MAWYEQCRARTVESGSAILPNRFLVMAADGQVDHVATAQGEVDGISGEAVDVAGREIPMIVPDGCVAKVEAGAAITVGALVGSDVEGRAIPHAPGANAAAYGRCVGTEATAAGQIISIDFILKRFGA